MNVGTTWLSVALAAGLAVGAAALFAGVAQAPPREVELAGYATTLKGRTDSQRHNARLSADELNGAVVPPGGVFSFNRTVKSWSLDQGYVKAPVSFDGELVRAFGGGVCQTSTTLYNAALLAGLSILERHPHEFAATYAPPGRDAAVAYPGIDLRFQNPYPWPLRIQAEARGGRVEVRILGAEKPAHAVEISTDVVTATVPRRLTRVAPADGRRGYLRSPGAAGGRVVTYRTITAPEGTSRRERLSDDTYRAMNRVIRVEAGL
jgi:vancomycin resistance protein YoaR